MSAPLYESSGRRLVLCDRGDCRYCGEPVEVVVLERLVALGQPPPWFWCTAEVMTLDRRPGLEVACHSFVRRSWVTE